jgi:nucleotide-binding universal stress UspA family protein
MASLQTILAPTDFSDLAARAVAYAFELASMRGGKVHLMHVYTIPVYPDGMTVGVDIITSVESAAREALAKQADKYASRPELGSLILEMGDASEQIIRHAAALSANLIVLGTHGRTGFRHMLLGSVAERVVRSSPCPVLVVPPVRDRK